MAEARRGHGQLASRRRWIRLSGFPTANGPSPAARGQAGRGETGVRGVERMQEAMSFFGKLLESGAPWWVVVGLIVFVVGALLLLAILAPGLLRRGTMQSQSVVINACSTASTLDR